MPQLWEFQLKAPGPSVGLQCQGEALPGAWHTAVSVLPVHAAPWGLMAVTQEGALPQGSCAGAHGGED